MPWYTLQTDTNYEAKVIAEIELRKKEKNILEIRRIFSPQELIVEYKDGKKKERLKRLYSNYLFIEMDYSDSVWHALKGIKGVKGFVGNKTRPVEVSLAEIEAMETRVSGTAPKPKVAFAIDAKVRITSGSFEDFYGIVKEVDYEKGKAKVSVNIFNRDTSVEIELTNIEIAK